MIIALQLMQTSFLNFKKKNLIFQKNKFAIKNVEYIDNIASAKFLTFNLNKIMFQQPKELTNGCHNKIKKNLFSYLFLKLFVCL